MGEQSAGRQLETSRLRLISLRRGDAPELFAIRHDPETMTYWDGPPDRDVEETREIVEQLLRDVASGSAIYWSVRLLADDRLVGLFDLSDIRSSRSADFGFMLARPFWGRGLAREACAAILDEARRRGFGAVTARIHGGNERSARLLRRLGFLESGSTPDFEVRPGVRRECRHFTLRLNEVGGGAGLS